MSDVKTFLRIQKMIWKLVPKSALITVLAITITGIMPGFLSFNIAQIISGVMEHKSFRNILMYLFLLILYYTFDTVIQSMNQVALNAGVFEECNLKLRSHLCDKRTRILLIKFEDTDFLEDLNKAQKTIDEEEISMSFFITLRFLEALISVLAISFVLLRFHPLLCLVAIISSLPVLINRIIRGKDFARIRTKQLDEQRKADIYKSWFYKEPYLRELRVYAVNDYIKDKWSRLDLKNRDILEKFHVKDYRQFSFCSLLKAIGLILSVYFTLLLAVKGEIDIAMASAALISFRSMQSTSTVLFSSFGSLLYYLRKGESLFKVLDFSEEENQEDKIEALENIEVLRGVFSYPKSDYRAINNLSLDFNKNEIIAFVGENGCGKTTLSKILLGLYPLNSGSVLYNGVGIETIDKYDLFKSIAYVPQIIPKLHLTIREFLNIGLEEKLSESEISKVFEELDIENLSGELDSLLGKEFGGIELSGGQWQRLVIAQSMLRNAKLFIYDEATSAIDPLYESFILEKILKAVKNHLSVIITHRLAICPYVDKIIVMKNGEIVEYGTHTELMEKTGYYGKMYSAQSDLLIIEEIC